MENLGKKLQAQTAADGDKNNSATTKSNAQIKKDSSSKMFTSELNTQNMQSLSNNIHQSTKALGISTLQLDPDISNQHPHSLSKRATNMSGLNKPVKTSKHTRSLISRIQIPHMDKEKAKQFNIKSTLNLSERSPLIQPEKPNMYARMPTIFALNRGDSDADSNSIH